jgi:hypothetical protein
VNPGGFQAESRADSTRRTDERFSKKKRPEPLHLSDPHYISDEALKKGIGF